MENDYREQILTISMQELKSRTVLLIGTGLLDVYCNPVRVLYNSGNLQSLADVFTHPICTGFNPELLVDYPMINLQKCDALPGGSSYVILEDVHTECAMITELASSCPVQPVDLIHNGESAVAAYYQRMYL